MLRKTLLLVFSVIFTVFLLWDSGKTANSVKSGLFFFASVLVPAIFPVTFMTSFIMKIFESEGKRNIKPFFILFFSIIGGYTVGAKLIGDSLKNRELTINQANVLSLFCTNAGIGFTVFAVGAGVLHSAEAGWLLFFCNILYPIAGFLIFLPKIRRGEAPTSIKHRARVSDVFCETAGETAQIMIKIGGFTAIFSAVNAFFEEIGLKFLSLFFEITTAVNKTSNLPMLGFLLGFGGISVIFQVMSIATEGIKPKYFILSRLAHGAVSFVLMRIILKVFKIAVPVFATSNKVSGYPFFDRASVSICAVISVIMLILSLEGKNRGGNLRQDLLQ